MDDIFADIRRHAGAPGGKFLHENVVLAAVEEILAQQSLDRSAVSYMGALMLSLQSESGAEPAIYAGALKLLERTLGHLPSGLLLSKAGRIAEVVVAVANAQVEQPAVLKPALGCVQALLAAQRELQTARYEISLLQSHLLTTRRQCESLQSALGQREAELEHAHAQLIQHVKQSGALLGQMAALVPSE